MIRSRPQPRNRVRTLTSEHWLLLGVLGVAGFFEGYDSYVFTVALPQIRQTFHLTQAEASLWLTVLFLGSLPSVLIARYADIHGRRRLLMLSIVGYTVLSGLTAISPSMPFFVTTQFFARAFLNAECALAWTIVAEEVPAMARGFGFGWLATVSALGSVTGSALYATFLSEVGASWRWLYAVALAPLAVTIAFRRVLPETQHYREAADDGRLHARWHSILRPPHRRWLLLVGITDFLFGLVTMAEVFAIDFMQSERGMSVASSNMILLTSGLLAIPFLLGAGALSDRHGRKLVGCSFQVMSVMGIAGFYLFARGPSALFFCLFVTMVGQFGAWPTLDAYYAELFPTGLRAFAGSSALFWRVPGEVLSLALGAALITLLGGIGNAAALLGLGPLACMVLIWRFFPETKGLELQAISEEISAGPSAAARNLLRAS